MPCDRDGRPDEAGIEFGNLNFAVPGTEPAGDESISVGNQSETRQRYSHSTRGERSDSWMARLLRIHNHRHDATLIERGSHDGKLLIRIEGRGDDCGSGATG